MSRFVRNFMIAQFAIFLFTQFLMAWRGLPVDEFLGVCSGVRWGFAWQWATHPFVELPGPGALFSIAITLFIAWSTYPRIESSFGRGWFVGAMAIATIVAGVSALAVAHLFGSPHDPPAAGAFSLLLGLFAFEAWARRNAGSSRIMPFMVGPAFDVTGGQLIAGLVALVLVRLVVVPHLEGFACDIGAIAGGVLAATIRERRLATATKKRAFGVIQGGRDWRDKALH